MLLDFLFYSLFTPVCTTMMSRVMFAGEQLMAAKSAVKRIEGILNEQPLPEPEPPPAAEGRLRELRGRMLQLSRRG